MRISGMITTGVMRGTQLTETYQLRIHNVLRFKPYSGTLNVKLNRKIDLVRYSTKAIDEILVDGTRHVEAYLAPCVLISKGTEYKCWAIWQQNRERDLIELISYENIREKFSLKDGDEVAIVLERVKFKKIPGVGLIKRLVGRQPRLSR